MKIPNKNFRFFPALVGALAMSLSIASGAEHSLPKINFDKSPIEARTNIIVSFSPVAQKVAPSVVNIYSTRTVHEREMPFLNDPFFRRFFGPRNEDPSDQANGRTPHERLQRGLGSGVIISEDGYILTNNHVVEGADELKVSLTDGRDFVGKLIGTDPATDVAIVKVDATGLPAITLADSSQLKVGDIAIAVGNPFGLGQTVTMGIVSATGRSGFGIVDYEDFIQTDASINPGNSGGALTDVEGRLIGLNTFIISRTGGNQGIGFAVPVNMAHSIMEQIIQEGHVTRGYLGVYIQPITPQLSKAFGLKDTKGALVGGVTPKSPAAEAGIKEGDIITSYNGQKMQDSRNLRLAVAQSRPESKVSLSVLRDGKEMDLQVTLGELPNEELAAAGGSKETESGKGGSGLLEGVELSNLSSDMRRQLEIPADANGVLVANVEQGSAAYDAGLREGDIIQEVNRKPVRSAKEAMSSLQKAEDNTALLRVWSQGGSHYLAIEGSSSDRSSNRGKSKRRE